MRALCPLFLLIAAQFACVSGGPGGPRLPPTGQVPADRVVPGMAALPGLEPGQEIRATVGTFPPFVGTVQQIQENTLRLRTERGEVPLHLTSIRLLEVRRHRRTRAVEVGVVG
ncbi:hypothetical protein ACFL3S_03685, partial [Gemmatimonadota bacterium]